MLLDDGRGDARRRLVANTRLAQAGTAIGSVVTVYLLVFAEGIVDSLRHAGRSGTVAELSASVATSVTWFVWTILGVSCVLAALRVRRPRWPSPGRWPWSSTRAPTETVLGAAGIVALAFFVEGVVTIPLVNRLGLLNWFDTPDATVTTDVIDSLAAGIGEEILAVAAPVTVMRFYRVPGRVAIPVLVAARMAYHLYYGYAGVWWLAPWALCVAVVYWRWPDIRLLGALIALHVAWNLQGIVFGGDLMTDLVMIGVALALFAVAFAMDPRWYRSPALPMTPTTSLRTLWLALHPDPADTSRRDPLATAHLWWVALAARDRFPRALAELTVNPSTWDFDAVARELRGLPPARSLSVADGYRAGEPGAEESDGEGSGAEGPGTAGSGTAGSGTAESDAAGSAAGFVGVDVLGPEGPGRAEVVRRLTLQRGSDGRWRVLGLDHVRDRSSADD
ncbi:CPBP family intramembrane glutamic endopeptidase [Gordonia aurantiaca]|uniref:CPBP family intramembrane glutamic endopeptidase n=1 Tax=Gordonia sp. B21 TaxID=3151852 RepID=UPI0032657C49